MQYVERLEIFVGCLSYLFESIVEETNMFRAAVWILFSFIYSLDLLGPCY